MKISLMAIVMMSVISVAYAEPPKEAPKKSIRDEMISPEATMTVDQEELLKRLIGEDEGKKDGGTKKLDAIIERMGSSARLLQDKNAGEITQETQRRIVADLDMLIEMAKKKEKEQKKQEQQQGQKKQQSQGQQKGEGQQPSEGQGGTSAAENSTLRDGSSTANPNDTSIHDVSRDTWNNLPPRDRDAITNAPREEILPEYRTLMEKYYKELGRKK